MAGNRGGARPNSGRKSKAEELGLQALLSDCVSERERRALFTRLLQMSKSTRDAKTSLEATKLLLAYLYGTPRQSVELAGDLSLAVKGYVNVSPDDWPDNPQSDTDAG